MFTCIPENLQLKIFDSYNFPFLLSSPNSRSLSNLHFRSHRLPPPDFCTSVYQLKLRAPLSVGKDNWILGRICVFGDGAHSALPQVDSTHLSVLFATNAEVALARSGELGPRSPTQLDYDERRIMSVGKSLHSSFYANWRHGLVLLDFWLDPSDLALRMFLLMKCFWVFSVTWLG